MIGQVAVGTGHDDVEQLGVVTSRDNDPQGTSGQRRQLGHVQHAGQLGGKHALGIFIAKILGHRDHQISGTTGEAGSVGLVGQPGGQAGNQADGANPFGENVGVEEVLLHELAKSGGELVLPLDDQRGMRDRQAQRTAEQGRHREPVCNATDHGGLGAGLHVTGEGPVGADRGHRHKQRRYRGKQSGGPPPCGGHHRRARNATDSRLSAGTGGADGVSVGSMGSSRVRPQRNRMGYLETTATRDPRAGNVRDLKPVSAARDLALHVRRVAHGGQSSQGRRGIVDLVVAVGYLAVPVQRGGDQRVGVDERLHLADEVDPHTR